MRGSDCLTMVRRVGMVLMLLGFFAGWTSEALAAGCHSGPAFARIAALDAPQMGLPQHSHLPQVETQCVYLDGEVRFFQVIDDASQPCEGPGCRGKQPGNSAEQVVTAESQRELPIANVASPRGSTRPGSGRFLPETGTQQTLLSSSGLFRPPRTV